MNQDVIHKELIVYQDEQGNEPFTDWLTRIRNQKERRRILIRLRRLTNSNFGDCKSVGNGIFELRMFFGPGYRVYFGDLDNTVLIICGGDKHSQNKDIKFAKACWKKYQNNAS